MVPVLSAFRRNGTTVINNTYFPRGIASSSKMVWREKHECLGKHQATEQGVAGRMGGRACMSVECAYLADILQL